MPYFFDKRFKFGLVAGMVLFVALNCVSYYFAYHEYKEALKSDIRFGSGPSVEWGFPMVWGREYLVPLDDGILNVLFALVLCAVVGTVFKLVKR